MANTPYLPDYPELLTIDNREYSIFLMDLWSWWLRADEFASGGGFAIRPKHKIKAVVKAKETGVFAGGEELAYVVKKMFGSMKLDLFFEDGASFKSGDDLLVITGERYEVLRLERVMLNFLGRMSAIAKLTDKLVSKLEHVALACTRKTLWSILDKKAVVIGGGLSHRLSFEQALMIKDNDWDWFKVILNDSCALEDFYKQVSAYEFVEFEVETQQEYDLIKQFIANYYLNGCETPLGVLFDNQKPAQLKRWLADLDDRVFAEASGLITTKNLTSYDLPGLDFVSMGMLTKEPGVTDLSLKLVLN